MDDFNKEIKHLEENLNNMSKESKDLFFNNPQVKLINLKESLGTIIDDYKAHIKGKNNDIDINFNDNNLTPKQQKATRRYEALIKLENAAVQLAFNNKFDANFQKMKQALENIRANEPTWFERSALQKLTDIMSLGIKPLIKYFYSKEKKFKKEIEQIKMGIGFVEGEFSENKESKQMGY